VPATKFHDKFLSRKRVFGGLFERWLELLGDFAIAITFYPCKNVIIPTFFPVKNVIVPTYYP
jgi:hypothetical protein